MNQQDQIALLAAALEEVGKMPEWIRAFPYIRGGAAYYWGYPQLELPDRLALAALCGVAAEVIAIKGIHIYGMYSEHWEGHRGFRFVDDINDEAGEFGTYPEALAAAVKIAGKGGEG